MIRDHFNFLACFAASSSSQHLFKTPLVLQLVNSSFLLPLVWQACGPFSFVFRPFAPELSLSHVHRQKSYSWQKPIRWSGQQIIEVMIRAGERQLIVIVSEAVPNRIPTPCLL